MKKAIALSFLLLANIILLAHAVIPHHHHKQVPVSLVTTHHDHSNDATHEHHGHDTDPLPVEENGNSHSQGDIGECLLEDVYANLRSDRQAFQSLDYDYNFLPCNLSLFSGNLIPPAPDEGLPFRQKPYPVNFYTEYISVSLGLRAPPIC